MTKIIMAVVMMYFLSGLAVGQDKAIQDMQTTTNRAFVDDTTHKKGWKFGALINVGVAQGSSQNWVAGAEKFSLSLNGYLNLSANFKKGKHKWTNSLDLLYALVNTTSQGVRKNDDRIDYFSKYTYQFKPKWGAGIVGNLRTQFTDGYDYNEDPKRRTSDFFAPAYITLAPGIDYLPWPYLSIFLSPAAGKWTVVANHQFELGPLYDVDPYQKVKIEFGAFLSTAFSKEVFKNVLVKSRLDFYSNYLKNPQQIDVFWTNIIAMKINKFLAVTYNFDLIYDADIKAFGPNNDESGVQLKSLLSVGFTGKL